MTDSDELQSSHEIERASRGWSRWDMLALGLSETLLPALGRAILDAENIHPDQSRHAISLIRLSSDHIPDHPDTPEGVKAEEAAAESAKHNGTIALLWVADNYQRLRKLKLPSGFSPLRLIGEGLLFFGDYQLNAWPGVGVYRLENPGYEKWRSDCRFCGMAICSENDIAASSALRWLANWYMFIWD